MDAAFPFVIPDPLPHSISPCPILEAILEIRFVTQESWNVLPMASPALMTFIPS